MPVSSLCSCCLLSAELLNEIFFPWIFLSLPSALLHRSSSQRGLHNHYPFPSTCYFFSIAIIPTQYGLSVYFFIFPILGCKFNECCDFICLGPKTAWHMTSMNKSKKTLYVKTLYLHILEPCIKDIILFSRKRINFFSTTSI